jgi:hypothetical protein
MGNEHSPSELAAVAIAVISELEANQQCWLREVRGSLASKQEELKVNIV